MNEVFYGPAVQVSSNSVLDQEMCEAFMPSQIKSSGVRPKAVREVIGWTFGAFPRFQKVQASCLLEHLGLQPIMEKIGVNFEQSIVKILIVKCQSVDWVQYAITRPGLQGSQFDRKKHRQEKNSSALRCPPIP